MVKQLLAKKRVFILEDDVSYAKELKHSLTLYGAEVTCVYTREDAFQLFGQKGQPFDLALIDLRLNDGITAGFDVARNLRKIMRTSFPERLFVTVAMSNYIEEYSHKHLAKFFDTVFRKIDINLFDSDWMPIKLASLLGERVGSKRRNPKIFIVHGQDEGTKLALKNYIQNTLGLGEPIILHERPSQGQTIIEKFEKEARDVDVTFVLLTPDDKGCSVQAPNKEKRRSRQNVIFELGYYYAKLQRSSGKVILLNSGEIELPSDISGIVYIDISSGIEASGEHIRRELEEWL